MLDVPTALARPTSRSKSQSLSVLQRATKADVRLDPYPHIVLPDALPEDLYEELAATFPSPHTLTGAGGENNKRWNYLAWRVRRNGAIPKLWRDFIAYHASQAFYDEIAALFAEAVCATYPARFPDEASVKALRAGLREYDTFARADILMDAMFSGNTPVRTATSVRTTHVDRGDKLFSGLFYMRPDDYDAVGGDLTISRFRAHPDDPQARFALFDGPYVDDAHVEHVHTVRYARNLLVLFINSLDAIHGVTVREPSDQTRLFINLVGEIEKPLYLVDKKAGPARPVPPAYRVDARSRAKRWFTAAKHRLRG